MLNKNLLKKFLNLLGLHFGSFVINIYCKTLRIKEINKQSIDELTKNNKNFIVTFWHGTMLIPWFLMRNKNLDTIVSQSKDGEILTKLLKRWNYNVHRGSSSRGGKEVLNTLIESAKNNYSIAITPDGPRGPKNVMKAGAVVISKETNVPLVLIGVHNGNKFKLKSWDAFEIPKPFSKVCVLYSEPIYLDKNLSFDETNKMIISLSNKLNNLQTEAEQYC